MTRLFDVQLAFFIPLWRRIALVVFCLGWGGFEAYLGNTVFAVVTIGIGIYCAHQFFLAFDPKGPDDTKKTPPIPKDEA